MRRLLSYDIFWSALTFALLAFLLFWGLGANYLSHWDEAWYADVVRNIAASGNLLALKWNGEPFFDKPPLYLWLSALLFHLFGISEFQARFVSALSGFGTVITTYFLSRTLFNKYVALFSIVILSSTIGLLFRARTGNLDVLLTLWIMLTIFSFYKAYETKKKFWSLFMGLSIGLGFLTKGAVAFAFPALLFCYLLFKKEKLSNLLVFIKIFCIGLIIPALWIFASVLFIGQEFINNFLFYQIGKFTTSAKFWEHLSFEYIAYLRSGMKLWFIPLLPSLIFVLYRWRNTPHILMPLFFCLGFIVLSFSENKSNWFLVPFYPILAIVLAYSFYEVLTFFKRKAFYILTSFIFFVALLQLVLYQKDYFVPDVTRSDGLVALAAKGATEKDDILYLTNYYFPTIVYYSQRKTYAVYSEHKFNPSWWIRPKTDWEEILKGERVFVITTEEELRSLDVYFAKYKFELILRSGDKLLLKKI